MHSKGWVFLQDISCHIQNSLLIECSAHVNQQQKNIHSKLTKEWQLWHVWFIKCYLDPYFLTMMTGSSWYQSGLDQNIQILHRNLKMRVNKF